jgi:hypothetical protein
MPLGVVAKKFNSVLDEQGQHDVFEHIGEIARVENMPIAEHQIAGSSTASCLTP